MARRSRDSTFSGWPSWRYGPFGESAIFNSEAEVPYGWTKKAGEVYVPPESAFPDEATLVSQLEAQGITIDPTWGIAHMKRILDGDISPTG